MPFATGTAQTPSNILKAINDLGVANGWTRLRGETDMACAGPKAAKFWRVMIWETSYLYSDYRRIKAIGFRETVGGANLSGTWKSSGHETGTLPGTINSGRINNQPFWVQVEFATPQTVRELYLQADTANDAPGDFCIQWSHDGITWTTMHEAYGQTWSASQARTYSWADGTRWTGHPGDNSPRRPGRAELMGETSISPTDPERYMCEDYWVWQLPGYDANKRIYLHARGRPRIEDQTGTIQFALSASYDPSRVAWGDQSGWSTVSYGAVYHITDLNTQTYWIYLNAHRLILVTKSGTDDYSSTYVGNLAAFSPPDSWPFPLCMASTANNTYNHSYINNRMSSACDPGEDALHVMLWDNTWKGAKNRHAADTLNLYSVDPGNWVWPFHIGSNSRDYWPVSLLGDYYDGPNHFLEYLIPTEQGDIPMFPCTLVSAYWGNLGYMDGMFAVPGGTLLPEQTFTIGTTNYRVFTTRNQRNGNNFFAVRED